MTTRARRLAEKIRKRPPIKPTIIESAEEVIGPEIKPPVEFSRAGQLGAELADLRMGRTDLTFQEIPIRRAEILTELEGLPAPTEEGVFPAPPIPDDLIELAEQDPTSFLDEIVALGRTTETESFLRQLELSDDEIEDVFLEPPEDKPPIEEPPQAVARIFVDLDGVRQPVTRTEDNSLYDERGNWVGFYNWADGTVFNPYKAEGLAEKARASFVTGIGDILSVSSGVALRFGFDDAAGKLSTTGAQLQRNAVPSSSADFQVTDLLNPEFYATKIVRTLPFALSLAPLAIGGYMAGAGLAAATGLGAVWSAIVGGLAGAALSRPLESVLEAGGQYNDAIARGKTEEEAKEEFDEVFRNNMTLVGADAFEIAIALAPTPKWVPAALVNSGLVRTARISGKVVIVGLSEGGEEVYQDFIGRRARGEEFQLDPVAKEVFAIGFVMGAGMGLGGDVISGVVNNSRTNMPDTMEKQFNEDIESFKEEGFNQTESELKALEAVAKTPEGEKIVRDAVEEVKVEEVVEPVVGAEEGRVVPFGEEKDDIQAVIDNKKPISLVGEKFEGTLPDGIVEESFVRDVRTSEGLQKQRVYLYYPEDNVEQAEEIKRLTGLPFEERFTDEWHATLGRLLGYSKADIQAFIRAEEITPTEGVAPLSEALITEGESIATQAEAIQPDNEAVKGFRIAVDEAKTATTPEAQRQALIKMESLEAEVREVAGVTPVAPEVPVTEPVEGVAKPSLDVEESIPPEIINEPTSDLMGGTWMVHDVNVVDRVRPARKVFDKMGLFDIWQSAFESETLRAEEQVAFSKELNKHAKTVGKDVARRELVWEFVNNSNQAVFNQLTFEEKQAALWWKRTADDWAGRLNIPQERRIKDYIPHIFDEAASLAKDLPVDASFSMVFSKKIGDKVKMPFLEKRLGKELGLVKDPFLAAQAYQNVALRKFYYEPILQQLKLISEHENTPAFASRYLKEYSRRMTGEPANIDKEINKTLHDVAEALRKIPKTGVARIDATTDRMIGLLDRGNASGMSAYNLTSALYVMWLGFKPTTAIRNLSQHGLIIAEVDHIQDFGNGIRLRVTTEGRVALAESLVVRSRRGAFIESIDSSMASRWTDNVRETALFLFRKADEQNVKDAFLSGYAEAKRLYPDAGRNLWIKRGDEVAMDTQYLYTKMNSMEISQSGPGKVGAMLTTWAINWIELMVKFVRGRPSKVYQQLVDSDPRFTLQEKNWLTSRKSLLIYIAIVGLAYGLNEQDWNRVRAFEYTGFTSIQTFANLIGGEFPGLELPGAVADVITGTLLGDDRKVTTGWNALKRSFSILNQVERVASGEREWSSLFFYLEGKDHQVRKLKEDWEENWKPFDDLSDPLIRAKEFGGLNLNTARKRWREQNPKIEAQMFVTNRLGTLSSEEARQEVLRLVDKHNIDIEVINGYEKIFGVDSSEELNKFQKRIGTVNVKEVGKDVTYFTTSSFLTELNAMVKTQGRSKVERDGHAFSVFALGQQDSWAVFEDYEPGDARTLYRQQNADVEASLYMFGKVQAFENPESAKILLDWMGKYNLTPQSIPAFLENPDRYDELFTEKFELEQKSFDLTTQFEVLETDEERDAFRVDNSQWVADMRRIESIDKNVPVGLQDGYVDYYTLPSTGFDQERFLKDNDDYYNDVWLGILGNQEIDFGKIPTVEFEDTLDKYEALDLGDARYAFRGDNPSFDEEGVRLGRWKPFVEREEVTEVEPEEESLERIVGFDESDFPSPGLFTKWGEYNAIKNNQAKRDQFRISNPDLDEWGVRAGIWTRTMTERRRRAGRTPGEATQEEVEERLREIEEIPEVVELE